MRFYIYIVFMLVFFTFPVVAQENLETYRLDDISIDITAKSAVVARDQAIVKAQRKAFLQLLSRLGTEDREPSTTDEVISSLVQAFEIQKEHARGERYTGTFSVQFRPTSVRELFGFWGSEFVDERSKPVVVLPIWLKDGRAILWEETTPWRNAWEEESKHSGLVPLILPDGDLSDIAKISTKEALSGKKDALQQIMAKYNAGGVLVVAIDYTEKQIKQNQAQIFMAKYDENGIIDGSAIKWIQKLNVTDVTQDAINDAANSVIKRIEKNWRIKQKLPSGRPVFLPVDVFVQTLADWAIVRQKMKEIPLITNVNVITMSRGLVHIELEFRGDIPLLQKAILEKGLNLLQSRDSGWQIQERL